MEMESTGEGNIEIPPLSTTMNGPENGSTENGATLVARTALAHGAEASGI